MKCQNCGEHNATYHKVEVLNGIQSEIHLCNLCASKVEDTFKSFSIGEFFADNFFPEKEVFKPITKRCDICKTKLSELLKSGTVGCSKCYKVFRDELQPIIESTQGINSIHLGKVPKKNGGK